jgi:hypothetical protein
VKDIDDWIPREVHIPGDFCLKISARPLVLRIITRSYKLLPT